ncbi:MAG: shikimate kinase [Pseudomonadota bacterium]
MAESRKYHEIPNARTIVLIGMMGSGKSTIGRRLAPRLDLPFFDADDEIKKAAGMSISELFETHGEESFREGEARLIARLLEGPPHVLATGGGAVSNPDTREKIAQHAISVWLDADVDTLVERTSRRGGRPLLKTGDPREILSRLLEERKPYYAQADIRINCQPGPHEKTVTSIIAGLGDHLGVPIRESQPNEL